jgi:PKD repeat protein
MTANHPPVAKVAIFTMIGAALIVTTAGTAPAPSSALKSYSIDWGDGTTATVATAPPATLAHTYSVSGNYVVLLTVVDNNGLWASDSLTINNP